MSIKAETLKAAIEQAKRGGGDRLHELLKRDKGHLGTAYRKLDRAYEILDPAGVGAVDCDQPRRKLDPALGLIDEAMGEIRLLVIDAGRIL